LSTQAEPHAVVVLLSDLANYIEDLETLTTRTSLTFMHLSNVSSLNELQTQLIDYAEKVDAALRQVTSLLREIEEIMSSYLIAKAISALSKT